MWEILWGFEPALITGFVIAGLILNLTPGADFLFIMSSGLSGGPRIGVAAALECESWCCGAYFSSGRWAVSFIIGASCGL